MGAKPYNPREHHDDFPDSPLRPSRSYLEKQREVVNLELAMMPRAKIGGEEWARKVNELSRLDAIIGNRR